MLTQRAYLRLLLSLQIGHFGRMRKSRCILMVVLVVAVLGAMAWQALILGQPKDPVYEGKTLSAWLPDIDYNQPQTKREKAGEAIRSMGTNALPFLLRDLDLAQAPRLKDSLLRLSRQQSLFKLNWRDADERSRQATWAFKALGAAGSPAIPELLRLEDSNPGYVPGALAGIGVVALPFLIQGLTNDNEHVRGNVAVYLANAVSDQSISASEAKIALPQLIANLQDTNASVRAQSAAALKVIDPDAAAKASL
jgi:hypothetical protein